MWASESEQQQAHTDSEAQAQGLGYVSWDGHKTAQTLLLGVTYGVFYFSAAPVTRNAYATPRSATLRSTARLNILHGAEGTLGC